VAITGITQILLGQLAIIFFLQISYSMYVPKIMKIGRQ